MSDEEIDYHCPACGELASVVFNPTQAVCGNDRDCNVIIFNPSDPKLTGGIHILDVFGEGRNE